MFVVLNRHKHPELTYGKVYEVLDITENKAGYTIINDNDRRRVYMSHIFTSLDKWRENKIDQILE
jgi:hypothetical protein